MHESHIESLLLGRSYKWLQLQSKTKAIQIRMHARAIFCQEANMFSSNSGSCGRQR